MANVVLAYVVMAYVRMTNAVIAYVAMAEGQRRAVPNCSLLSLRSRRSYMVTACL